LCSIWSDTVGRLMLPVPLYYSKVTLK